MSGFLDFFANGDMRIALSRFLPVDAYASLALVCRATRRHAGGEGATKSERMHFCALYVVRPLLSLFTPRAASRWDLQPLFDATREDELVAEVQHAHDAKFAAWASLGVFDRLRDYYRFDPMLRLDHDLDQALRVLHCPATLQPMQELPLSQIMSTPLKDNAMAIGTDARNLEHVTIGSVVMRFMWRAGQYPQWVEHVLATPDAEEARRHIKDIDNAAARRGLPGNKQPYTPLMFPSNLHHYFGTAKSRISKDKPKPLSKSLRKEIGAQYWSMRKLRDLYDKYALQREAQFEADQLIPKIMQQQQGHCALSDADLGLLLSVLKRSRASRADSAPKRVSRGDAADPIVL